MEKMSKFNSPKNKKIFIICTQKEGAHVQCMYNEYAKFIETKSATMNIFRKKKYFLPKSFVKVD